MLLRRTPSRVDLLPKQLLLRRRRLFQLLSTLWVSCVLVLPLRLPLLYVVLPLLLGTFVFFVQLLPVTLGNVLSGQQWGQGERVALRTLSSILS